MEYLGTAVNPVTPTVNPMEGGTGNSKRHMHWPNSRWETDVSGLGLGAVLSQMQGNNQLHPVACASHN